MFIYTKCKDIDHVHFNVVLWYFADVVCCIYIHRHLGAITVLLRIDAAQKLFSTSLNLNNLFKKL